MARIRSVKPEFWTDEDLSALAPETHLLAVALLNHADDEGYFKAHHKLVEAACCPLREDSRSVLGMLQELSSVGYIVLGTGGDGKRYGYICNFTKHQRVDKPSKSKIAEKSITWDSEEDSWNIPRTFQEDSCPDQGSGSGDQGSGIKEQEGKSARSKPSKPKEHPLFAQWYQEYPLKKARGQAAKAFAKLDPDQDLVDRMIQAIHDQQRQAEWKRKAGEFVAEWPHPATWINGERWLDEVQTEPPERQAMNDGPQRRKLG